MKRKFNFLGNDYNSEGELALALHNNFADALNYIFTDDFLNSFDDAYLRGRVLVELRQAKYVESALAAIIYLLNPDLGLSVRGKSFKNLNDLAIYMHSDDELHLSIEHLFSDHVISHTLGLAEDISDLTRKKLIDIENNIQNPAIYKLFVYLYNINFNNEDYHGLSRFDYYFYSVTTSKDPFKTYVEVLNNLGFKADLLKSSDINEVLSIYQKENLPFLIYRDLLAYLKLDISTILTTGSYNFIAKNLKHYKTKGLASKVKKQMKKLNKKLLKPQLLEKRIQLTEKLYLYANLFISLFDLGLVKAKAPDYALNISDTMRTSRAHLDSIKDYSEYEIALPVEFTKKEIKPMVQGLKDKFKEIKKN